MLDWDGCVLRYTIKYLSRHAWRVGHEMDMDDLLQESYLRFVELQQRYEVEDPKHFMGLWKVALRNWMHGLANARTRRREVPLSESSVYASSDSIWWDHHLAEAHPAITALIRAVDQRSRRLKWRKKLPDGCRETTNAYLCRLAGIPQTTRLRQIFDLWLGTT